MNAGDFWVALPIVISQINSLWPYHTQFVGNFHLASMPPSPPPPASKGVLSSSSWHSERWGWAPQISFAFVSKGICKIYLAWQLIGFRSNHNTASHPQGMALSCWSKQFFLDSNGSMAAQVTAKCFPSFNLAKVGELCERHTRYSRYIGWKVPNFYFYSIHLFERGTKELSPSRLRQYYQLLSQVIITILKSKNQASPQASMKESNTSITSYVIGWLCHWYWNT